MLSESSERSDLARKNKLFSSFDSRERVREYQSQPEIEILLNQVNERLAPLEIGLERQYSGRMEVPALIVTGMPRSGTTLVTQMLSARFDLGYPSNLMARLYEAPLVGAWLQNLLMRDDMHGIREFQSHHGVTGRAFEPHEFGYFWTQYFETGTDCHARVPGATYSAERYAKLELKLRAINGVFGRPTVFKCGLVPFLLPEMMKHTSVFCIHIVREKAANVRSVLRVREERLGDQSKWWSLRPREWEKASKWDADKQVEWQYDQVVGAVRSVREKYNSRFLEVRMEDLVENPEAILLQIVDAYSFYGNFRPAVVGGPIKGQARR